MCKTLKISRNTFYYEKKAKVLDVELENQVLQIFHDSTKIYGTRNIKTGLAGLGYVASRRKIARIMNKHGLKSVYKVAKYKNPYKGETNNDDAKNLLVRHFNHWKDLEVLTSDLTYMRVGHTWSYICLIINLYNRAIVGYSVGKNKTHDLVYQAFVNSKINFSKVSIFHTDRGSEFKNAKIDEFLKAFNIRRSLSAKGNPWDNAVSEAMYKTLKTEFVRDRIFSSIWQLEDELVGYINWYNKERFHSSLGYVAPLNYRFVS